MAELHLPDTLHAEYAGDARAYRQSIGAQPLLIIAALIAVYIVLGVLYESLAHPLTIISTLPSAGLGALLALQIFNTELSLIAFIGIILLIGIVKKNGIMMVDFALEGERKRGLAPERAIFEACLERFRPIMMTTLAALLGALPLVVATGPGSELRRPLGITIVGGLLVSQVLTLYTTPVIYLLLDKLHRRLWGTASSAHEPGRLHRLDRARVPVALDAEPLPVPADALPRIAIATGDPAGIGPEVSLKAALDAGVRQICRPLLVGDPAAIELHAQRLRADGRAQRGARGRAGVVVRRRGERARGGEPRQRRAQASAAIDPAYGRASLDGGAPRHQGRAGARGRRGGGGAADREVDRARRHRVRRLSDASWRARPASTRATST